MKHAFVLASLVATSTATAAPKPLAADKHEPPVWLDAARNLIRIFGHSDGYQLLGEFRVAGVTSTTDRVRMEVRSGAKVISKVDCRLREWKEEEQYVDAMCDTESNLTASGPLKVSIVYIDDQTDKEYLAETLEVQVKAWNSGGIKGWTMTPDDLLALAWVIPNAGGFDGIAPSSMQSGKRPIRTTGNRVLVDSRIPKAKNQETRIRPDALKRSIGYGVAWPDGPGAKAAQAAFPAAVGKD